jgi:hypothetical protein
MSSVVVNSPCRQHSEVIMTGSCSFNANSLGDYSQLANASKGIFKSLEPTTPDIL